MAVKQFFQKSQTGSILSVAAGLSFYATCMLLSLVGRAGVSVPYADQNQKTFLSVLGLTFLLAGLATWSKLLRRSQDESPCPVASIGLCVVCVLIFALQVTGVLAL